jgi:hypothetical protein
MDSDETLKRYSDLKVDRKEQEVKEKEYPEIAMEVGKFVREVGRGMWHCKVHNLPISPLIKVCIYTLDGQVIATNAFASSCFRDTAPDEVTKAVIKEIGGYAASSLAVTGTIVYFAIGSNPGFWVVLGIGLAGAAASVTYSWLVNVAWKLSSHHYLLRPTDSVYATPNIEGSEFIKSFQGQIRKVRTKRTGRRYSGDAMPVDLFDSRQATRGNYVGITTNDFGSSFKWLIKLK